MSDFSFFKRLFGQKTPGDDQPQNVCPQSADDLPILLWIILPAWILAWFVVNPPHGVDIDIARLIASADLASQIDTVLGSGGRPFLHVVSKWTTIVLASAALITLVPLLIWKKRAHQPCSCDIVRRLVYFLAAVGICVAVVSFLKQTTGVFCPNNTVVLGGTEPVTSPVFGLTLRPGKCWPGGAAGSGFCLFALFFALRGIAPRLSRANLILALALGSISGFERMTSGLHFISHNIVSLLVDWLICAALYRLFFVKVNFLEALKKSCSQGLASAAAITFMTLWWVVIFNGPTLWHTASIGGEAFSQTGSARLFLACAVLFAAAAAAILTLVSLLPRKLACVVMMVLHTAGAISFAAAVLYGAVMTPDMVRNALATDLHESSGYLGIRTLFVFFWSFLPPAAALCLMAGSDRTKAAHTAALPVQQKLSRTFKDAASRRLRPALASVSLLAAMGTVLLTNYQIFAGAVRSDRSLRYQLVPVSLVSALVNTVMHDASPDKARLRLVTDSHPQLARTYAKPTIFVVVVGETTRSKNWSPAGYMRDTANVAANSGVISFPLVTACGTSTDVSLPCMMSRIGRSDYDRKRILNEEALPDILQRAGYEVQWIDNQSGCKGVCNGVPSRTTDARLDPTLCPDGSCYDGILVKELENKVNRIAEQDTKKPVVLFLHMMGQHGPAYSERSPASLKVYGPECLDPDLSSCSREEIVNAYDNGVHYTSQVLQDMIQFLAGRSDVDSGLIFVSDHGESLGEKGLYLHGSPYFLGISEQINVPMFMWFSEGFAAAENAKIAALSQRARELADANDPHPTHENLYHTMLSLLGVKSSTYRADYDLTRSNPPA